MSSPGTDSDTIEIDLRRPGVAALLAWLLPGAGHFYQRRYAKGVLFMVCVLGTYFFGLTLGGGHVVYASWKKEDRRWQYFCQLGAGLPALPALEQARRVSNGDRPLFDKSMPGFMTPPMEGQPRVEGGDELAQWNLTYKWKFELATLYTMVAGLLNILAVYDAYGGPMIIVEEDKKKDASPPTPKPPAA